MPNDKREAKFYYMYRVHGIADIYWALMAYNSLYLLFATFRALLGDRVGYWIILVVLIFEGLIRCSAYCFRELNW